MQKSTKLSINENNGLLKITLGDNGKDLIPVNLCLEGFGLNQIKARINNLKGNIHSELKANAEHHYN
jgi:signal transduction histidine kinase